MVFPYGARPLPNLRQPLRVETFFVAHSETGERLASSAALGVALGGAALIDELLRPVERIRIVDRHVLVVDHSVSGDPVADWLIGVLGGPPVRTLLAPSPRPSTLRDAIHTLARDAYERTAAAMYAGNLVVQPGRRRLVPGRRRYPPSDPHVIPRIRGRLISALTGSANPDPQTDSLGGLVLALDLVSELYLDGSGHDVPALLRHMVERVSVEHPAIRQILADTHSLIGEAAVRVYGG
ncbi:GOLPH3/VPS74 family protein [Dactylosporangium sp. CA-139066]|uniref:GOLPH3/VPS74 family protein n=1 Tax=Dactylosporangium sp. CA-139066 TaxID=3239930 RepID=UPI003D933467